LGVYLQPVKSEEKDLISEFLSKLNDIKPMAAIEGKYDSYRVQSRLVA